MIDVSRAIIDIINIDLLVDLVIFKEAMIISAVIHKFRMIRVNDILSR